MGATELRHWLLSCPGFRRHLEVLTLDSIARQFPDLVDPYRASATDINWNYLLLCASMLSEGEGVAEETALRIAQYSMCEGPAEVKDAAGVVLDSLVNRPALSLAQSKGLLHVGLFSRLPVPLQVDYMRRALEHRIDIGDGTSIEANRFQQAVWERVEHADWTSISAPTSAGKSFIVRKWLEHCVRGRKMESIVYLVPTRALIQEVEDQLKDAFKEDVGVTISSFPTSEVSVAGAIRIYVFTQERLHVFMERMAASFAPDMLVVDEAQKVGEGARGVLLQQVIDAIVGRNPRVKVVLISPMTKNPEVLLVGAPHDCVKEPLRSEQTTVNQNLIWVVQVPGRPKEWRVDVWLGGRSHRIGRLRLSQSPAQVGKRLPFIAKAMSQGDSGSLVYVNSAGEAEKVARQLWDLVGEAAETKSAAVAELVELAKYAIHPQYALADVVTRGVGFHYGNMPLPVRKAVEDLFRSGELKFLVCTSTLIEGVNLPCRSIYVRAPTKGRGQPMSGADFWNLAGRAGRWGKEFQGNVVCVDPSVAVWGVSPPKSKANQEMKEFSAVVEDNLKAVEAVLADTALEWPTSKRKEVEHVVSYLLAAQRRTGGLAETSIGVRLGKERTIALERELASSMASSGVPLDIAVRNPGITPHGMSALLNYFRARDGDPEELNLVPAESDDAVKHYVRVFGRVSKTLGDVFGQGGRVFQCAMLVVNWLRGYPLARLINEWIRFLRDKGRAYSLAAEIRRVMEDVEGIARYEAPRYLACYCDILRFHWKEQNREDLAATVPDLSVFLEFGVSQKTQVSLMRAGLSRTAAIAVSEFVTNNDLGVPEVLEWLRGQEWEGAGLPALVLKEVRPLLVAGGSAERFPENRG